MASQSVEHFCLGMRKFKFSQLLAGSSNNPDKYLNHRRPQVNKKVI